MLKIRLMRIGAKKRPFYRVVVIDERSKRSGEYLELLGTYNPLTEPHEINLKQDRIDYWKKQGAQMSDGYLRIIGKAPQRPARKPKKEKKTEEPSAINPQSSDKTEEKPMEETPAETSTEPETTVTPTEKNVIPTPSEVEGEESIADAIQNESGDSSPAVQNDKVEAEEAQKNEGSA